MAVKVHKRNYIGATPGLRTRQFNMGNGAKKYDNIVNLLAAEAVQVRDNSIESSRMAIVRYLTKHCGKDSFFMRIRVYPHQILRENKQAQGAHADRIQKGMSHPFGKPAGRAARVRDGTILFSVLVEKEHVETAKKALKRIAPKLTCKTRIGVSKDVKSIGAIPTKTRAIVEAAKAAEAKEAETKEGEAKEGEKEEGKAGNKKDAKPGDKKEADKDAKAGDKKGAKSDDKKASGKKK